MASRAEEEARERAREARRQYLRGQIADRRNKINRLNQYKGEFRRECARVEDDVLIPKKNYDLTATFDISHWTGQLQEDGEIRKKTLEGKIGSFLGEIADVIVRIDGVINRLENEISSLERELAAV